MIYSKLIDCKNVVYVVDYESSRELNKFTYESDRIGAAITAFKRLFRTNFMDSSTITLYKIQVTTNNLIKSVGTQFLNVIKNKRRGAYVKALVVISPQENLKYITYLITQGTIDNLEEIMRELEGSQEEDVLLTMHVKEKEDIFFDGCWILEKMSMILFYNMFNDEYLTYKDLVRFTGLEYANVYKSDKVSAVFKEKGLLDYKYHESFSKFDSNSRKDLIIHKYSNNRNDPGLFLDITTNRLTPRNYGKTTQVIEAY